MSTTAREHNEWLSLVEVSGPFLSVPVLGDAFPQGLDKDDEQRRAVVSAWQDWVAAPSVATQRSWIRFVLHEGLGWTDAVLLEGQSVPASIKTEIPESGETLRPDAVLVNPPGHAEAGKVRLVFQWVPAGQPLDRPSAELRWKVSPASRMQELLRSNDLTLGLLTNGEHWMLVWAAPNEPTGYATWDASYWQDEPQLWRSFASLLCAYRFFSVEPKATLEGLLRESAEHQQEVTDRLGQQVRSAVEVLIQTLDRLDLEADRKLLAAVEPAQLYEACLTVMMRLVFLLCAEERGMLPLDNLLYNQFYAVSTLSAQLREAADMHGEEILGQRKAAWSRLLAVFRAVYAGVEHEDLRLPAYGGRLFDPDRFPFLEGRAEYSVWREDRAAVPPPIDDRTVLHLMEALQVLQVRVGRGGQTEARRLSFRALDIEQIGHVYEGLLDHTAVRAKEPVLAFAGSKDKDARIPLVALEVHKNKGDGALVEFLHEEIGKTEASIAKAMQSALDHALEGRLQAACAHDAALLERVEPFAMLLRTNSFDYPVVIPAGSVYVAQGTDRRTSGTHYTPRSLTEPLVRYTLEPLVYEGPAEGWPREKWRLRPAGELLSLKICDMAMGSGAFLVQTCRYMSERLLEAWEAAEREHAGPGGAGGAGAVRCEPHPGRAGITPEGLPSVGHPGEQLIPREVDERVILARRLVAERCLFGVDKNPMAVEMAKLSLWLITMQKDRPFEFLDHALKCGDSLLGVTQPEQLQYFHLDAERGKALHQKLWDYTSVCRPALERALAKRRELESFQVLSIEDAERKAELLHEAQTALKYVKLVADLLVGAGLTHAGNAKQMDVKLEYLLALVQEMLDDRNSEDERESHLEALRKWANGMLRSEERGVVRERRPFHWALEFPEVFSLEREAKARGFDAMVGNPPFQGGKKITGALGTDYRDFLLDNVANGERGCADLCAYFLLRARTLLRVRGQFGLLATNTIAQGETRHVGLDQMIRAGSTLPRINSSTPWPGSAALEVSHIWLRAGEWLGQHVLDGSVVDGITSHFAASGKTVGRPQRLVQNDNRAFQGTNVFGVGFTMSPEDAYELIHADPKNREILFPYLNGEDLTSRPDQSPSRWIINFSDWPHEKAELYPACLKLVIEKVKPDRDRSNTREYREKWWQFARRAVDLYRAIDGLKCALVTPEVGKYINFVFRPTTEIFSHMLIVFATDSYGDFGILQSTIHEAWARDNGSTLETRFRYTPVHCYSTFPQPRTSPQTPRAQEYYTHRAVALHARTVGLTGLYNCIHGPTERSMDILQLRGLQTELDQAVAAAYGWSDLDLGHGFHETKQGIRFTISEPARREVLDRLLALNHERYEEECRQGLHDKAKSKTATKRANGRKNASAATEQTSLFEAQPIE